MREGVTPSDLKKLMGRCYKLFSIGCVFFGMCSTLGWCGLTLIFGQQVFLSRLLCNANNFRPTQKTARNRKHLKKPTKFDFLIGQINFGQGALLIDE
jgi:hypothetical protein